jgi:hypothetical protein
MATSTPEKAAAVDVADIESVRVGEVCVAKGMRLQDLARRFERSPSWEFRWDEKMVRKTGMVAGLIPRNRAETPYVLQFNFLAEKPIGHAVLVRIGWGGKQEEASRIAKLIGCSKGS